MKTSIIAALAVSVIATPVLAAPGYRHDDRRFEESDHRGGNHIEHSRNDVRVQPRHEYRVWHKGDRFESRHAPNYRVIDNPRRYRLGEPPRGYRWVRSGDDAVLVALRSGIVRAVVPNAIR